GMLLERMAALNLRGKGVIQAFDANSVVSARQLAAAYLNASSRFSRGANRTKSMANEMLLFVALTNQINDAIRQVGAEGNKDIVIFADSKRSYSAVSSMLANPKAIPPKSGSDIPLLQRMALLQIEGN
ncbi:MAG: hypothetical protein KGH66_03130, partial [Candidatus Micrarchaeota archaeon]|nr:hypothetical protein [Candidatus Micrarchaeota archaeon]